VIGLGLNLFIADHDGSKIEQDWVDINEILGKNHQLSRNQLIATLIEEIIKVTSHYTQSSFALYRDEWREFDCMRGQQVCLFMGNSEVNGNQR